MNRIKLSGPSADVLWSYHKAAALGRWELVADISGGTVTAQVVTHDTYAVSQRPLVFVVPRPNGQPWRWDVQSLQIEGDRLTATLATSEGETNGTVSDCRAAS